MTELVDNTQYIRKASLIVLDHQDGLDLTDLHFTFKSSQADEESPNNCSIRVHNLGEHLMQKVQKENNRIILQAGYESSYGVIFDGTIKQFRIGREPDGVTTYLDLLAADGDIAYNYAMVNESLAAGSTAQQRIDRNLAAMKELGVSKGTIILPEGTGGTLPRGKVLWGLASARLRAQVQNVGATWTIKNGKVNIIPLTGYLPGEAVVVNSDTGLIGRVEQTANGMTARCLLNPKLVVGGLVRIDAKSINQTSQQGGGQLLAYDKIKNSVQNFASVQADGLYRIYVAEYSGDTRGQDWYVDLTCLSVDQQTNLVKPYG